MSITFYLATRDDAGRIGPACDGHTLGWTCDAPQCADDVAFYGQCDHLDAVIDACPVCSASLNLSNANAVDVLGRLGVEFDWCGVIDGADLLGRAMVGNVGADDSGIAAADISAGRGARVIDCGRPAGYFADRLGRLADIATVAGERGLLVAWA